MLNVRNLVEPIMNEEKTRSGVSEKKFDKLGSSSSNSKLTKLQSDEKKLESNEIVSEDVLKTTSAPLNGQQPQKTDNLRIISLDEIAWHDTPDDCWFAIYDYVYDCTPFIRDHPGGDDVLLEYAGRDATLAFIGAGHSKFAQKMLKKYLIGELPYSERIFRIPGGLKVDGV